MVEGQEDLRRAPSLYFLGTRQPTLATGEYDSVKSLTGPWRSLRRVDQRVDHALLRDRVRADDL